MELSPSKQGTDLVSPVSCKFLPGTEPCEPRAFSNAPMLMIIMMIEKNEQERRRKIINKFYQRKVVMKTYRTSWTAAEVKLLA